MKTDYSEAFSLTYYSAEGESPVCRLLELAESQATLAFTTAWQERPQRFHVTLRVPAARLVRFPWDDGLFGHEITFPGGSPRFCPPRLRSETADRLAAKADRQAITRVTITDWRWDSWYDRVYEALVAALTPFIDGSRRRRVNQALLQRDMQWALNRLVNGGSGSRRSRSNWSPSSREPGQSGLALTDEVMLLRHMFEVELGYPDCSDDWLYEQIKLRFLAYADDFADILCSGKKDTGRFVIRTRPGAPVSHLTGRPISDLMLAIAPLSPWSNPTRVAKESRSLIHGHRFVHPVRPPLTLPGVKLPEPLAERIQTLTICIGDLPGWNLFRAGAAEEQEFGERVENNEEITLDALLVTPSGRAKLLSYEPKSALLSAEEFQARRPELEELPGFECSAEPELIETLADETPVYDTRYRYRFSEPVRFRHDKLKLLQGGLKGVGQPIPQLYYQKGEDRIEIDLVVSELAVLSKGARDAAIYPLLAQAGVRTVDPGWSFGQLEALIAQGLAERGLPPDGRFEVLVRETEIVGPKGAEQDSLALLDPDGKVYRRRVRYLPIGHAICGPSPVMRAVETEYRQSNHGQGVRVDVPTRMVGGLEFPEDLTTAERVNRIAGFHFELTRALEREEV